MVKIRLMRVGKRKQPSFRVVVADARSPRDGRIIEAIGHYQPRQDPSVISIDNDRALFWLQRGAQPSDSVRQLLRLTGAWSTFTGEAPPANGLQTASPSEASDAPAPKATPAASVKATPAASVTETDEATDDVDDRPAASAESPTAAADEVAEPEA